MLDSIQELETKLAAAMTAREKIDALNTLAWQLRDRLSQRGVECAQTAYELAQAEKYESGMAYSLVNQSLFILNDRAHAFDLASQALVLFERRGDRVGQCRAMLSLCSACCFMDDFVQSLETGRRGLALAQEVGDQEAQADLLINLGLAYKRAENYDLAYTVYHQARALYQAMGDHAREGLSLIDLALAHTAHGQHDLALTCVREYEQLEIDEPRMKGDCSIEEIGKAYALFVLGQIYIGKKEVDRALGYLSQAVQFAYEHAEHNQVAQLALQAIGQAHIERHELDQAILYLKQGLAISQGIQSNLVVYRLHEMLSQVYEAQENLAQALFHHKQFHDIKEKVFNDKNTSRRQALEIQHQTEIARRAAEINHLRNVELENEIAERKRLEQELELLATTDELTRIPNRRHFLAIAQIELKRAQRFHRALSLALLDLDHFKQINDTFGHAAGDQALTAFAQLCPQHIRGIDLFARFGGDEFALLLPETDETQSALIIERMRQVLLAQPIQLGAQAVRMTLSIGIAALTRNDATIDALLARADQALYCAKQGGRNQIQIAENETAPLD
jgi:diguanylate cyclase (GGDEF)-like protein